MHFLSATQWKGFGAIKPTCYVTKILFLKYLSLFFKIQLVSDTQRKFDLIGMLQIIRHLY